MVSVSFITCIDSGVLERTWGNIGEDGGEGRWVGGLGVRPQLDKTV